MSLYPKIKLSELRRIGWRYWDPTGLSDGSEFGPDGCADEYDRYLTHVVNQLTNGGSRADSAAYLSNIATEHMGLSRDNPEAPRNTVDAIAAYLKELPDSPPIAD